MKKMIAVALTMIQLVTLSGCATIVSGKTQDISIRTTPPGADVLIDGSVAGTSPMIANLVRKRRHEIQFKMAGQPDVSRGTTRGFNWWYLGNAILGGIIGLIVDPITGAMYKVKPEDIHVDYTKGTPEITTADKKQAA